ncbi:Rho-binding antiterminator [Bowmanella yangjiangensis]|uniref:Rho-binding antiterminator n=1 Tax=Bowmanella yangjiangensis TaxID=2811230 RepID=A0ABS3CUM0_9ALTE|nr:Rho-binding antiterminator [Bowmanella yangjiangensis]MBN7820817.1 Rho-binding antiterminator [Bowmanella yangjiangensis]
MKTPTSKIIACAVHDYIEVACLYAYELELRMLDGQQNQGKAMTTRTQAGREWLVLQSGQGQFEVELNQVRSIKALTVNRYFSELEIGGACSQD